MRILGIGNALIDVLVKLENDDLLRDMGLAKGSMNLIDIHTRNSLFDKIDMQHAKITTGGAAGNTCLALAKMGIDAGFIGKIGNDDFGTFFVKEYIEHGVQPHLIYATNPSGAATVLITPDGERTFCTYLGVAAEMHKGEMDEEVFKQYTHLYIEGYLVQNHALIEGALAMAKRLGLFTALDLASFNVVEEERDFLRKLIVKYVDIVFANEAEAKVLTGKEPEEALQELGQMTDIAVVKVGGDGSWIVQGEEEVHVGVETIVPTDTTAAGDYYAAGFLYGMKNNCSLAQCAEAGSLLAGEIIKVVGTKLGHAEWENIYCNAKNIVP
jgi:Sugar kinases, ribokinase family